MVDQLVPTWHQFYETEGMSRRFVVGENEGPGIIELGYVFRSRQISISGLENVKGHGEVPEGILEYKENLKKLELEWKGDAGDSSQVQELLKRLRPHIQIECIWIRGYSGTEFPNWVGDPSFSNLKEMHLDGCNNLISLPPLGQLPSLEELSINCPELLVINRPEFYGSGEMPFSSLKTLEFRGMKKLREWKSSRDGAFPILEKLELCDCPKLTCLDQDLAFPIVEKLELCDCPVLENLHQDFFSLKLLRIIGCGQLNFNKLLTTPRHLETIDIRGSESVKFLSSRPWFFNPTFSSSLTSLTICGCSELVAFPRGRQRSCPSLEELELGDCPELKSVHIDLPHLKRLRISGCRQLDFENLLISACATLETIDIRDSENLTTSLEIFHQLIKLVLRNCSNLESLTSDCRRRTFRPYLEELELRDCPKLMSVPTNLSGLKRLRISGCGQLDFDDLIVGSAALETIDIRDSEKKCMSLASKSDLKELLYFSSSLEKLELCDCPELMSLLSDLPSLKILRIKGCGQLCLENVLISACATLETLDIRGWEMVELLTNGVGLSTPNLTSIYFGECSNLKTFGRGLDSCPCLQELGLINCPKLISVPSNLPSLKQLQMKGCGELDLKNVLISACATLETIDIYDCEKVTCIPLETFPNLKVLDISYFWNLKSLGPIATTTGTSDPLRCSFLTSLSISHCSKFVSFPRGGLDAPNLKIMVLWNCRKLKLLPQGMHQLLPSLEELNISDCPEIESLPDGGLPSSLSVLGLRDCPLLDCPSLENWCEANGIWFRRWIVIEEKD